MAKPYVVACAIVRNEETMIKYSIGSIYDHVDEIIVVDSFSTDKTLDILKEIDTDKKITIIKNKWQDSYCKQRNVYLQHMKKKIYPKHRRDLYYLRIDADEVYHEDWISSLKGLIESNEDKWGFRSNFYSFTADYNHLDETLPMESRVSVFKYTPDITYVNDLHEIPIHPNNGTPLYGNQSADSTLGILYAPGTAYNHYAWCDVDRCFTKAKNYTKEYVKQGTETLERLNSIEPSKDSWWWDKKSSTLYKGKLPLVFEKYGLLPGQKDYEEDVPAKISVFTIIKNAIKFDYPIIEAINSVLPMADEVVVNVGTPDEDGTIGLLHKAFDGVEKVKIFESEWEGKDQGVKFLTSQTNKAKDMCKNEWCLYMQADELYKEEDLESITKLVKDFGQRKDIVAFKFKWLHFDGDYVSVNLNSYPEEVRLVRKDAVVSIRDAQSFGLKSDPQADLVYREDCTLDSDVHVFHYGWAKQPDKMLSKLRDFDAYYHDKAGWDKMHGEDAQKHKDGKYDYGSRDKHGRFDEEHPRHMYPRISRFERSNKEIIKGNAMWTNKLPVVSIIVPTWNMSSLLKDCIGGLAVTVDVPFEVIVVNNDSTDDTREFLDNFAEELLKRNKMFLGYKAIHNPENRGWSGAANIGVLHSKAPFISFVANDILVPPKMYSHFVEKLLQDGTAGVISPWYTEDNKWLQNGNDPRFTSFYKNYSKIPIEDSVLEKWHFAVCSISRRDNYELIGDWDEKFTTHCNDNDWEIRLRALKYKHHADKSVVCFHQYGSFGRNQIPDETGEARKDAEYFYSKWKQKFTDKVSELADDELLKEEVMTLAKAGNYISEDQKLNKIQWKKMESKGI